MFNLSVCTTDLKGFHLLFLPNIMASCADYHDNDDAQWASDDDDEQGFDDAEEAFDAFLPPCVSLTQVDKTFDTAEECIQDAKDKGLDLKVKCS